MSWEPILTAARPMVIRHVGMRHDEVRIYLSAVGEDLPRFVLRLVGVFKLYDSLQRGATVEITDDFPHGSFGWDIPDQQPHHSINLRACEGSGFLIALAREIEYGVADRSEAINWPA